MAFHHSLFRVAAQFPAAQTSRHFPELRLWTVSECATIRPEPRLQLPTTPFLDQIALWVLEYTANLLAAEKSPWTARLACTVSYRGRPVLSDEACLVTAQGLPTLGVPEGPYPARFSFGQPHRHSESRAACVIIITCKRDVDHRHCRSPDVQAHRPRNYQYHILCLCRASSALTRTRADHTLT
jgi:hypothetical protein